ncbi:MAG: hypothetical protein GY783_19820, partial [Gammaproteobacteria bacterium]|nr:hypothetical protein [Gammaproteobacteria bacterium]
MPTKKRICRRFAGSSFFFESLILNHAFVDGNKRVASFVTD